jgi:hypothetical protein
MLFGWTWVMLALRILPEAPLSILTHLHTQVTPMYLDYFPLKSGFSGKAFSVDCLLNMGKTFVPIIYPIQHCCLDKLSNAKNMGRIVFASDAFGRDEIGCFAQK